MDQEVECLRQLKEMEDRMDAQIEATVEARALQILLSKRSRLPQNPTLQGYARVTIDRILDKKYNKIDIEYPIAEDRPKLGHNKGSQVAWRKRFIKLDHQLSSDDEDDCESSPTCDDHSLSPNRDHSPPHPLPSPKKTEVSFYSSSSDSVFISPEKREDSSSSIFISPEKIEFSSSSS